jgi:hypothetical protein
MDIIVMEYHLVLILADKHATVILGRTRRQPRDTLTQVHLPAEPLADETPDVFATCIASGLQLHVSLR